MGPEQREAVGDVGVGDELAVGLVEDDDDVVGHPGEERLQRGPAHGGPRGVVRVADEHHPRVRPDGLGHRVEVVDVVGVEGHRHGLRVTDQRDDRVGLERPPREHHLLARCADGLHELLAQRDRPAAHRDPLRGHAVGLGEPGGEGAGGDVGVAVAHRGRLRDRVEHAGQRGEGGLVARELDRAGHGAAGDVGGQRAQVGADRDGHGPTVIRSSRPSAPPSADRRRGHAHATSDMRG